METHNPQTISDFEPSGTAGTIPSTPAKSRILILILILGVAALLRLNRITQPFTDAFGRPQATTATIAANFYRYQRNIFFPQVNWNGPDLSYQGRDFQTVSFIAALFHLAAGQYDWISRSVSVAFGLWGIFALYQLARRVWDEDRALVSAAVLAALPGAIFIERSFLPDPAMVALVLTSLWMLVAYFQTDRWPYLLLATLFGTWGVLTKLPGVIAGLPATYAMLVILNSRRKLTQPKFMAIATAGLLILFQAAVYYVWARRLALAYPPHNFVGYGDWLWEDGLDAWLKQSYFLPDLGRTLYDWLWTVPTIILVLLSFFFSPAKMKEPLPPMPDSTSAKGVAKAPWFFHWWLIAGVVYYILAAKEMIRAPWTFHILNPVAAALAGHTIASIASILDRIVQKFPPARTSRLRQAGLLLVTATAALLAIGIPGQHALQGMYDWPGGNESYALGLTLRQVAHQHDLVVTITNSLNNPSALYYSQRRGWVFPSISGRINKVRLPPDDQEAINLFDQLRDQGATWLGLTNERAEELRINHPTFMRYIEETSESHTRTSTHSTYRILGPDEVAPVLVRQEIRYYAPEAGEVFLVWGIDGWAPVPEAIRPNGTELKESMHTAMSRHSDTFIVSIQVPIGAALNYGFLTTKKRDGSRIEDVWQEIEDHPIVREDGVIKAEADSTQALLSLRVKQEFRYLATEVSEVVFVWGINDWQVVPVEIRPAGTVVKDSLMHTPMQSTEGIFTVVVEIPAGTLIDYGFLVTEKRQEVVLKTLWDHQPNYQITVAEAGMVEIDSAQTLINAETTFDLTDIILNSQNQEDK